MGVRMEWGAFFGSAPGFPPIILTKPPADLPTVMTRTHGRAGQPGRPSLGLPAATRFLSPHTHMHTHTRAHMHKHGHGHTCTHTNTDVHTHTHVCTRTHKHDTLISSFPLPSGTEVRESALFTAVSRVQNNARPLQVPTFVALGRCPSTGALPPQRPGRSLSHWWPSGPDLSPRGGAQARPRLGLLAGSACSSSDLAFSYSYLTLSVGCFKASQGRTRAQHAGLGAAT